MPGSRIIQPAPYVEDFSSMALALEKPGGRATFVSSGPEGAVLNRFSMQTGNPIATLSARSVADPIELGMADGSAPIQLFWDFKAAVSAALSLLPIFREKESFPWSESELPFTGGIAGFISYEFGARFERMPVRESAERLPALWFGVYPEVYIADRLRREGWRISRKETTPTNFPMTAAEWPSSTSNLKTSNPVTDWERDWEPSLNPSEYRGAVEKILGYLERGDVYQVNLTNRFRRSCSENAEKLFVSLLRENPSPLSALIETSEGAVISSSPELLLDLRRDGWAETRPIKGTLRADGPAAAEKLLQSAKDRAEHLMIVDLERSDLGRICRPGSIHVDPFMTVEPHPGLHHLVSGVRGKLRPGLGPADAIAAIFPGGSVTGAPKVRAMEIIHELEPVARGVYTGAIGWITPEGEARFNLAIRTLTHARGMLDLHVGGGIVIDSDPDSEAAECRLKGAAMARAVDRALAERVAGAREVS